MDGRGDRENLMMKEMSNAKLLRRQNGMIGGVCGGLAEFTGISAFWFRLLFVIMALPGGVPGLLAYLLLWIVIPKQ